MSKDDEAKGWHRLDALPPEGVFDVLARYYDAGLNRFLIQRFTGCIAQDMRIMWAAPFVGTEKATVDLWANGYRPLCWKPAPSKDDLPSWLEAIAPGPEDFITSNAETTP